MERASNSQLFLWKIEALLRQFSHYILPASEQWLQIAFVFIILGILVVRARISMKAATIQLVLLSFVCAVICAVIDGFATFGEAFNGQINPYRTATFFSLTALASITSIYFAWRRR